MKRYYYGFLYMGGEQTLWASTGRVAGYIYAFSSASERDTWVSQEYFGHGELSGTRASMTRKKALEYVTKEEMALAIWQYENKDD